MDKSQEIIEEQLKTKGIDRDADVTELYLAKRDLDQVQDLAQYKNLKFLWLNGNQLHRLNCLSNNYRLQELYLHNNRLVEITGALSHLTSLKTLMLHGNQLEKLEKVVKELRKMQHLKNLNLFNNPIAQETEYRLYVIHHLPSLELLDRQEISKKERDLARKIYDQTQETIRETIAFGRRSEGPPSLYYPGRDDLSKTTPENFEVGNNYYRDNPPFENPESAVNMRAEKRSIMQVSSFDWSRVPRAQERRLRDQPFEDPQIITKVFR